MANVFHILLRDAEGKLIGPSRKQVKDAGIKLSLTAARTPSADSEEILEAFRRLLPKAIKLPDVSPFVVLRAAQRPGGIGPVAACQCQCSVTSSCGGGGGGH